MDDLIRVLLACAIAAVLLIVIVMLIFSGPGDRLVPEEVGIETGSYVAKKDGVQVGTDDLTATIKFQNKSSNQQPVVCWVRVYDKPGSVVATRRSEITWLGPNENIATPVVFTITDIGEDFYAWDLERCWGLEDVWG
jgi:hypothetical protein